MKPKAILFDLDGTLLPMNIDTFVKAYFGGLAAWMAKHGYDPKLLVDAVMKGTYAMVTNDGEVTNEERFWQSFAATFGEEVRGEEPYLEEFYHERFDDAREVCGFIPEADAVIKELKRRGYRVILATNPIFPRIATEHRIKWAGLDINDFELVTTYENSRYTKPDLNYYHDILNQCGLAPDECLMVGNDVGEDMVVRQMGMRVFLLPLCLINKQGEDISKIPNGSLTDLIPYIEAL